MRPSLPALSRAILLLSALAWPASVACSAEEEQATNSDRPRSSGGKGGSSGKSGSSGKGGTGSGNEGGSTGAGGTDPVNLGANGGSSGGGGEGSGGSAVPACNPACVAPQACGKSGVCLDPGTCAANGDCEKGTVCDTAQKKCVPGSSCGAEKLEAEQVAPNVLIVLDRSCSMTKLIGSVTKWQAAVAALNKLTADFKGKIRFGLAMFPDLVGEKCSQDGPINVPVGDGVEFSIQSILTNALLESDPYFPANPCVTNIDTAMSQAAGEPSFLDTSRKSFVLLVSDGAQSGSCGGNSKDPVTTKTIADLFAKGVGTFVVGFGAATDFLQMDQFATAGGYPNPDPNIDFYPAENAAALEQALTSLAKKTLGCTFALAKEPPSADSIYVFFNKTEQILKDTKHQDGWDYDPATKSVIFYGAKCQALTEGTVTSVDIVFGCPGGGETVGAPPNCTSGIGCDSLHLCPDDPQKGSGYCEAGCCKFQKIE